MSENNFQWRQLTTNLANNKGDSFLMMNFNVGDSNLVSSKRLHQWVWQGSEDVDAGANQFLADRWHYACVNGSMFCIMTRKYKLEQSRTFSFVVYDTRLQKYPAL